MPKRVLLTGGAGFIGHHFVEGILKATDWEIIILDKLDISGNLNRLSDIKVWPFEKHRVKFLWHDLRAPLNDSALDTIGSVQYIIHLAAASHVDRSITHPLEFVADNVTGTAHLLEAARGPLAGDLERFVYFSTDEVYGPAPPGRDYVEGERHNPANPYAASKSGAEALCRAYRNTYGTPIQITNTMNVFGERQHPEKFIPLVIRKCCKGEPVTIHADATCTKAGSRFYIHARNVCAAVLHVLEQPLTESREPDADTWHIRGEKEVDNLALAQFIAQVVGEPLKHEMVDFHSSRPGHDLRYAMDGTRLKESGWAHPKGFEESLEKCIRWMLDRPEWLMLPPGGAWANGSAP